MVGVAHLKMNRPDLAGPLFARIARTKAAPSLRATGHLRWPARSVWIPRPTRPVPPRRPARPRPLRHPPPHPPKLLPSSRNKGKSPMKRIVAALVSVTLLAGCGVFGGNRPTDHADRRPAHSGARSRGQVEVDPALAAIPVTIPPADRQSRLGAVRRQCRQVDGPCRARRHADGRPGASASATGSSFRAPAGLRTGRRRRPRLHDRHARPRPRLQRSRPAARLWERQVRGENSAQRDPVRRRRQLRRWPHLRDQRRRRRRRARRRDRQPSSGR